MGRCRRVTVTGRETRQDRGWYPERQNVENKTPGYYRKTQREKTDDAVGGIQEENYASCWGWKKTGPVWRATCTDMAVTDIVLCFRPGLWPGGFKTDLKKRASGRQERRWWMGRRRKRESKRGMALYKLRMHQIRGWGAVLHSTLN